MNQNQSPGLAEVQSTSRSSPMRPGIFFVTCAARTGSTLLVNLLQSHPRVMCHMEIFNPTKVEGFSGSYRSRLSCEPDLEPRLRQLRQRDPAAYIYKIAFDPQARSHVGFKFKYEELLLPEFAGARCALMQDLDIKIIHLRRRNLLRRFLSWWIATRVTGVTMVKEGEAKPSVSAVRLDPSECLANFENTLRISSFVRGLFKSHDVLEIDYEDLSADDPSDTHRKLLEFLGLEVKPLRTQLVKLAEGDLSKSIENYNELFAFFRETPYAAYFEESVR